MSIKTNISDPDAAPPPEVPAVEKLTHVALKGEPKTDKAFKTPSGTLFRVRVIVQHEGHTGAPTNGNVELAPTEITLSVTLSLLDADKKVAKDAQGRFIVTDKVEILISERVHDGKDVNVRDHIDLVLRQQAYLLEQRMKARSALGDVLSDWGNGRIAGDS